MKKEKTIRTYQRRTKTGKVVTVKQHTAKYDAAEALKEAAKKKGAGDELEKLKKKKPVEKAEAKKPTDEPNYGFTADEYKAWYHWDQDADPKNKAALKVEKALKKQMGTKAYNKYFDDLTDNYSARGHNKAFKGLSETLSTGEKKSTTSGKETKLVKGPKEPTTLVAHVDGDNSVKYKVTPTSPMVKDVAFTKYLADDTYSETFPKGGSYEFFYAKRNKGGDVGLYAKRGNDIFELEETEPSKALAKKLGAKSSKKESKTPSKELKSLQASLKGTGFVATQGENLDGKPVVYVHKEGHPKARPVVELDYAGTAKFYSRKGVKDIEGALDKFQSSVFGGGKSQKGSSTKQKSTAGVTGDFKGHPKVIAKIDKLIQSYQKDIEKAQKHIDAGEVRPGGKFSRRMSYKEQKKYAEKQIKELEKGREAHLAGKENKAWRHLRNFVGFSENNVVGKETRAKNKVAAEKKQQKRENDRIKQAQLHAQRVAESVERSRKTREAMSSAKRIPADLLKKATTKSRNGKHPVTSIYYGDKTLVEIGGTYYKVTKAEMKDIRAAMPSKPAKRYTK